MAPTTAGGANERRSFAVNGVLLSRGLFFAGLVYPLWFRLTPGGARDSWLLWSAVAAMMIFPASASPFIPFVKRYRREFCGFVICALTAQFFLLAALNGTHPFYCVASVLMAVNAAATFGSLRGFLNFAIFALTAGALSFAYDPHGLKLAYMASLLVVFSFTYGQLRKRSEAECEVLDHQENLERKVDERARQLSRRKQELEAANQRLENEIAERERVEYDLRIWQKLEGLSRLAGGVAHDFNNILTAIAGNAALLQSRLEPGSDEYIDVTEIVEASERAAGLTCQLMAFSRQNAIETSVLDLNRLVQETESMLTSLVGENVLVRVEGDAAPARIRANRNQIDQVLINFAVNARDAMPKGGELVYEIRRVSREEAGPGEFPEELADDRAVLLRVTDTGVGMDAETAAHIFDPFFSTKDVDQGTGLGLAAVYGIVQQSGAKIRVESEVGRGTRFEIHWPEAEEDSTAEQIAQPSEAVAEHPRPKSQARILLVEDDPSVRRFVARVLEDQGYRVQIAFDAENAVRVIQDEPDPIDLMVTDVVMPRVSGVELASEMAVRRPETKVLYISGHLNHPSLVLGVLPQDALFLPKPFGRPALVEKVEQALASSPTAA